MILFLSSCYKVKQASNAAIFKNIKEIYHSPRCEKVNTDVLAKCNNWDRHIIIQYDNAGAHGGGRGSGERTIASHNKWDNSKASAVTDIVDENISKITFISQPS